MRTLSAVMALLLLLTGCAVPYEAGEKQYSATFLEFFDTVTTVVGKADSEESFKATVQPLMDELEAYHRLFDIYNSYDGINNLKTVNDSAGAAPVEVDKTIIELLTDCKEYYEVTGGVFNPAMGSVLTLWHDAREDGINNPDVAALPDGDKLSEASFHMNPDDIILDSESSTVFFADPLLKIDVGAIAKGWAVERVCDNAPDGLLISVGGNVCATGPKDTDGTPWAVGIQAPDGSDSYVHVLNITSGCVVTSGSYQRAYAVDGKLYHHIIDPRTLYPSEGWTSVSVVCHDSGLADMLSTSLFLLSLDEGQALLDRYGAEALWIAPDGSKYYSTGFYNLIRN